MRISLVILATASAASVATFALAQTVPSGRQSAPIRIGGTPSQNVANTAGGAGRSDVMIGELQKQIDVLQGQVAALQKETKDLRYFSATHKHWFKYRDDTVIRWDTTTFRADQCKYDGSKPGYDNVICGNANY